MKNNTGKWSRIRPLLIEWIKKFKAKQRHTLYIGESLFYQD